MNKHFEDTQYYLGRAVETAKEGVKEELGPVQDRVARLTGGEDEPEPSRLEKLQGDLERIEDRAEGKARRAVASARDRVKRVRDGE